MISMVLLFYYNRAIEQYEIFENVFQPILHAFHHIFVVRTKFEVHI